VYFFLLNNVSRQKKFIRNYLEEELKSFKNDNDGSLSAADFKKITSYYALGVPAILGESLAYLREEPLTEKERSCLTYLGGISGLLDDLFDDPRKEADHLKEFIKSPEKLQPTVSHEKLLLYFYKKGLSLSPQPEEIKIQAEKVYEAQQLSLQQNRQAENFQTSESINEIVYSKGGSSFIFYRLCLKTLPDKAEVDFLYHLGGLMQLGNDIFDVWEDHQSNTLTAATICTEINELRTHFLKELKESFRLGRKMNYDKRRIKRFLKIISLAISRVFVCLDQFENLQSSTGNKFIIEKYSRKQLICNMQKISNQFKAMGWFLKN